MSRFDDSASVTLAGALQSHHGESVTYTPSGGSGTVIVAVVDREGYTAQGPDGTVYVYPIVLHVARADVATVVRGKDTVALKKRLSDSSTTTFYVGEVLNGDGGMWELGLTVA